MRRYPAGKLMMWYSLVNVALLLVGIFHPGLGGLAAVLLTSFFMSIMFPTIFAMGLKDLGANTNIGGSLLVMAIIGGAVMTPLMGLLAEHTSTAAAYQLPLYSYLGIAAFASYMTYRDRTSLSLPLDPA